jgi:hypothetical protein
VKKVLLGQVEFQLQKHKDEMKEHEPSAAKRRMAALALDGTAAMLKSILDDGKTLGLTFAVKPDADELAGGYRTDAEIGHAPRRGDGRSRQENFRDGGPA